MSAQYSLTYNETKQQLKLKIYTPDAEEPSAAKCSASESEVVFICAPYLLKIRPHFALEPGEYFPKFDDDKYVFEYKLTTTGDQLSAPASDEESTSKHPYGFNSAFIDNLDLMRDELKQMCGIDNPDQLAPKDRRAERLAEEDNIFQLDHYKHDYWSIYTEIYQFVQEPDIPLDYPLTEADLKKLDELTQRPMVATQITDTKTIDLGLIDLLLAISMDWRQSESEINEATSAWIRQKLSATLSYFEVYDTLDDVFHTFYRRSFTYPLFRAKIVVQACIQDVYGALEKHGQPWILKQLLSTYRLFNTGHYCILNRFYIVEYIKYVHRFVSDDDARLMGEMLKDKYMNGFDEVDFGWNLDAIDMQLIREMFYNGWAVDGESDDEPAGVADAKKERDDTDEVLSDELKNLKV